MMCAGECVCWFSTTQKCVTLSTTEAEYVALGDTIKEAMFIWYVWSFIFPGFGATCMTVFEDNEGARHLAQNPASRRTRSTSMCGIIFQENLFSGGSSSLLM